MKNCAVVAVVLFLALSSVLGGSGGEGDDWRLVEVIRGAVRDGLYEYASEKAEEFLRKYPSRPEVPEVSLLAGIAEYHRNRLNNATALLKSAIAKGNRSVSTEARYWFAMVLMQKGEMEKAEKCFSRVLKDSPAPRIAADALMRVGWIRFRMGKTKEAVDVYVHLLERFPRAAQRFFVMLHIGKWMYALGRYEDACRWLKKAVEEGKSGDDRAEGWYWLAEATAARGEYDEAIAFYGKAMDVASSPRLHSYARYGRAWTLSEIGRKEEAMRIFLSMLKDEDVPVELIPSIGFKVGSILHSAGEYEKAIGFLERAVKDEEYAVDAGIMLADCYYRLKRYRDALRLYRTVKVTDPRMKVKVLIAMGRCHEAAAEPRKAEASFEEAVSVAPDAPLRRDALFALGDMLLRQGNYKKALRVYGRVMKEAGNDTDVWVEAAYRSGMSLLRAGDAEAACGWFVRIVEKGVRGNTYRKALKQLAACYGLLKKYRQAMKVYLSLLEMPDLTAEERDEVSYMAGMCCFNMGDVERAEKLLASVRRDSSVAADALYGIALCRRKQGDDEGFYATLKEFLRRYPRHDYAPEVVMLLGNGYFSDGRYEDALCMYDRFLQDFAESPQAAEGAYRKGLCLFRLGRYQEAIKVWRGVLSGGGGSRFTDEVRLKIAEALWKSGRVKESVALFDGIITAGGSTSEVAQVAALACGDCFASEGNYASAVKYYRKALEGPSKSLRAKAQLALGKALYDYREYAKALDAYALVTYVYRDASDLVEKARIGMAKCLERLGRYDEAVSIYTKLVKKDGPVGVLAGKRLERIREKVGSNQAKKGAAE